MSATEQKSNIGVERYLDRMAIANKGHFVLYFIVRVGA